LVGRSVLDFVHPDDVERARFALANATPGPSREPWIFRWRGARSGWRSVATRSVTYGQEDGATRIIAVGRDVTDEWARTRKPEPSEQVEPANLLAADDLSLLAGGVAHDFNNLLTISLGVTDLISEQVSAESPIRAYLAELATASRTAAELARQLLSVTGRRAPSFTPVEVVSEIRGLLGLLRSSVSKRIALSVETGDEPLWVEGDAARLRRLLLNLVVNASEAIGDGPGTIRVRAFGAAGRRAGTAVIEVEDDGPGMPPELCNRIFDAGFTTKERGHGLGLAVVRSVVERSGGQLRVESAGARGTIFRVEIPLLPQQIVEANQRLELVLDESPRTSGVVLLVDDDDAVRRVSAAMLGLAHLEVIEARTAQEARSLFAATPQLICAVIDLVMPDGSGLSLVDEFRAARPGLKLVVCSGAHDRLPVDRTDVTLLEKPFRYAELIEAVCKDATTAR
jgi:signal transduction histidine kinase/CheY-like chemotaxis protein